jgi:hypothetical protein
MYIHVLARELRRRKLEDPNLGALLLCALTAWSTTGVPEVARAAPVTVVTAKRPDELEQPLIMDGPENAEQRPEFVEPAGPAMPPGRGMQYAMEQANPWPYQQAAIQSMVTFRNAALLDSITAAQKTATSEPAKG